MTHNNFWSYLFVSGVTLRFWILNMYISIAQSLMKLHVSWHVLDMCTATWHVWDPSRSTQHPQKPLFWHLGHICSCNGSKDRAWTVWQISHVGHMCGTWMATWQVCDLCRSLKNTTQTSCMSLYLIIWSLYGGGIECHSPTEMLKFGSLLRKG